MISGTASATVPASPTTSTAVAELRADAGEEEAVIVDEDDAPFHRGSLSSTSVPAPGALVTTRAAARPLETAPDRLADPLPVTGHRRRIEAGAAIAHEDGDLLVRHVRVDVDLLDAGELCRVRHRLARGEHDRGLRWRITGARELDADAVELLDVGRGGRERRDERRAVVAERPRGVEPAAQLALLAPCERGDTTRLARVTLDQRQRLQHRVVHALGHLGALIGADARRALGVALQREPPEQRPANEHEGACHGARREQPHGRASALQQEHDADAREHDAAVRERRVGPESTALAQRERQARRDERDAHHAAVGHAERTEQGRAGDQQEEDRPAGAILRRPGPQREVEHDSRTARERQQSEDEPHERGIHAEGLRDSRADPREGTPFSTRREGAQRHPRSLPAARDAHLADADMRVEHEDALAGLDDRESGVAPVVRLAEDVNLPELGIAAHLQRDVLRDDDAEVTDVDPGFDVRLPAREADIAQVESQLADSELVRARGDPACRRRRSCVRRCRRRDGR